MTDRYGIDDRYIDALGAERHVSARSLGRLREIIGEPTLRRPPVLVVRPGDTPSVGPGELHLEDGEIRTIGHTLPGDLPFGYHDLVEDSGEQRRVISSPGRCHLPSEWRAWGWAAQLYAARSSQSWGIGDLADLRRLNEWSRRLGAAFVLINPIGAVAPSGEPQPSPYFPTSRRFRSPLYLRVEEVPGAGLAADIVAAAARAGRDLNQQRIINRGEVWRIKRHALEAIWRAGPPLDEFERWYQRQAPALTQFATWSALADEHGPSWTSWPGDCRRPDGTGLGGAKNDRVRFHAWLQWLLAVQLDHAARALPVIQDLPIGVDREGFDAWAWQDLLALDASVGAPPDEFIPNGQDWGLPPFVPWRLAETGYEPFIETIRASIVSGGGLRIDHVMGLSRLWWIAAGTGPADGAYVRYPARDVLAIVALESHRAGAVVIGGYLGTVETATREALTAHNVLSYRLLWFEPESPDRWPRQAMAAVTTHDLPTVAGLWDGSDLATQRRLGTNPNEESTTAIRSRLGDTAGLAQDATTTEAVRGAYRQLALSPSVLLSATLDDALAVPERPNLPGADGQRPNWSLALPATLDDLESAPSATAIAVTLSIAVNGPTTPAAPNHLDGTEPEGDESPSVGA